MKAYKANLTYLLDTLASYESADIEDDIFEVAVNDDQFGTCRITVLAAVASKRVTELERHVELLRSALIGAKENQWRGLVHNGRDEDHPKWVATVEALSKTEAK